MCVRPTTLGVPAVSHETDRLTGRHPVTDFQPGGEGGLRPASTVVRVRRVVVQVHVPGGHAVLVPQYHVVAGAMAIPHSLHHSVQGSDHRRQLAAHQIGSLVAATLGTGGTPRVDELRLLVELREAKEEILVRQRRSRHAEHQRRGKKHHSQGSHAPPHVANPGWSSLGPVDPSHYEDVSKTMHGNDCHAWAARPAPDAGVDNA